MAPGRNVQGINRTSARSIIPTILLASVLLAISVTGFTPTEASAQPNATISGPLYGSIPNVTIDGIPSGGAPWVVNGHVVFGGGRLTVSGTGLFISAGYTSTGATVPTKLVGTTGGLTSVVVEIRDVTGGTYLTSALPLTPAGAFSISTPVQLSEPVVDPVVLVGLPGTGTALKAWIASSDFLADFGHSGGGGSPVGPPSANSTSLQAIGPPSIPHCCYGSYTTTLASGGTTVLKIAGQTYQHGFQLNGDWAGGLYAWHIRGAFHRLTALVGLDSSNTNAVVLQFPSAIPSPWNGAAAGFPINDVRSFTADGANVTALTVNSGLPTRVSVNVTGVENLYIFVDYAPGFCSTCFLDFVNDGLS